MNRSQQTFFNHSFQMLQWIRENRHEFLVDFTEIGDDLEVAEELREEHKQFEENCGVGWLQQIYPIPRHFSIFIPPKTFSGGIEIKHWREMN